MTTPDTCRVCSGELIGAELAYGTCGHCGGRSLDPNRRREVAVLTMRAQPSGEDLDSIEAAYLEEGYRGVHAIAVPASFEAAHPSWEVKVVAEGNPYRGQP